jgi:hypothetical protein
MLSNAEDTRHGGHRDHRAPFALSVCSVLCGLAPRPPGANPVYRNAKQTQSAAPGYIAAASGRSPRCETRDTGDARSMAAPCKTKPISGVCGLEMRVAEETKPIWVRCARDCRVASLLAMTGRGQQCDCERSVGPRCNLGPSETGSHAGLCGDLTRGRAAVSWGFGIWQLVLGIWGKCPGPDGYRGSAASWLEGE